MSGCWCAGYTVGQKKMELDSWAERQGYKVFWGNRRSVPQVLGFLAGVRHPGMPGIDGNTPAPGDHHGTVAGRWRGAAAGELGRWRSAGWNPTGTLTTAAARGPAPGDDSSVYLPISSLYATWPGERFLLHGQQRLATRILGKSHLRALLPPDVALLLAERCMVLDFSSRPFDGLELARMDELAEQLLAHLPQRV